MVKSFFFPGKPPAVTSTPRRSWVPFLCGVLAGAAVFRIGMLILPSRLAVEPWYPRLAEPVKMFTVTVRPGDHGKKTSLTVRQTLITDAFWSIRGVSAFLSGNDGEIPLHCGIERLTPHTERIAIIPGHGHSVQIDIQTATLWLSARGAPAGRYTLRCTTTMALGPTPKLDSRVRTVTLRIDAMADVHADGTVVIQSGGDSGQGA